MELHNYYSATRQCGHTTAALGKSDKERMYMLYKHNGDDYAKTIASDDKVEFVPFQSLANGSPCLRGMRKPLVIDHAVLDYIFCQCLNKFYELETENSKLRNKLNECSDKLNEIKQIIR